MRSRRILKILVAAPGADIPAAATRAAAERTSIRNAGKAFLYRLDGPVEPRSEGPVPSPVWVEADSFEFVAPKPSDDDEYGFGVAVSDATVLVGAPYVDNSVDTGSAFFYTDPPILAMSSPKPVHAGSTTVLTKADLDLIAEPTAKKIVFELLSIPQHRALLRDGNPLLAEQTFTREDIANGLVSYIHEVPDTRSDGFTFTATADDIFMVPGTDEFVFAINGPPTLSNIESSPVEYREGAEPIQITEDITVQDDSDMIREATVIIQSGFEATADELGFLATNKIRGEWNDKTMTLALTGLATVTEYQQALRSVTFSSDPTIVAAAADDVGSVPLPTTLDRILMAHDEGDFVKLGDMTFGQFSYTRTGNSPGASQVTVSSPDGEALRFTGPFFDLPDAEVSTATIEYTVTGNDIYRVTLAGNPSILGTSAGESRVTETVQPENQELVIFNIKPGEPPLMVEDARQITPADTLDVVTEIFLESRDLDAGSVTLSVIEQRFIAEGRSMRTIEFVVVDDDGAVSNTVSRQIIVRDSTDPGVHCPRTGQRAALPRLATPRESVFVPRSASQIYVPALTRSPTRFMTYPRRITNSPD